MVITHFNPLTLRSLTLYIYMEHLFLMFLVHTQRRSTVGRTPLDEWSARRRDLYLTTHDTHNRQISMPTVGFEPTISAGERPQAHPVCKMRIIHEPKKVALWNKRHFEENNRECAACLKSSVLIVVEKKKYIECNIWRVAVRPSYI